MDLFNSPLVALQTINPDWPLAKKLFVVAVVLAAPIQLVAPIQLFRTPLGGPLLWPHLCAYAAFLVPELDFPDVFFYPLIVGLSVASALFFLRLCQSTKKAGEVEEGGVTGAEKGGVEGVPAT